MDMVREEIIELELSIAELVDVALGTNYAQRLCSQVHLDLVDVNDVAPTIVRHNDVKRHASLLSSFLLENSLNFGVTKMITFQKVRREYR